jgi:hypothetical protein
MTRIETPVVPTVSRDAVRTVLGGYPELTDYGIRRPRFPAWTDEEFRRERDRIGHPSNLEPIGRALYFLRLCRPAKTVRRQGVMSSYALKHIAEPAVGYTTNGQFIIASIFAGWSLKTSEGPNPMILCVPPRTCPPVLPDGYGEASYPRHLANLR